MQEDLKVRQMLLKKLVEAGVPQVEIERSANQMTVTISSAKPGIVIGKSGAKVEELRRELEALTGKKVRVTIQEIRQPELDATLVARSVAEQMAEKGFLQARHEAGRWPRNEVGRQGDQGCLCRAAGRRRDVEARVGARGPGSAADHFERTSTSARPRRLPPSDVVGVKVWVYKGDILPAPQAGASSQGSLPPPWARAASSCSEVGGK